MTDTAASLVAISVYLDEALGPLVSGPGELLYARAAKVQEEAGETMEAVIGFLGHNPRKGKHKTQDDLLEEMMDTALTSLVAAEHVVGNTGTVFSAFLEFIEQRKARLLEG